MRHQRWSRRRAGLAAAGTLGIMVLTAGAQTPSPGVPPPTPRPAGQGRPGGIGQPGGAPGAAGSGRAGNMFTRVDDHTYTVGQIRIDTQKRELVVPGRVNDASTLEFVANPRGGAKAYESAITIDGNAVIFNAALLLLGLDPARSRVPVKQFDPIPPQGDPVEITVTLPGGRRVPIEDLIYDTRTKKSLKPGPWVYTGSTFVDRGQGRQFLAQIDGVVIGLMHGPQALIDNPRNDTMGAFGYLVLNPNLGLKPDAPVTLTIRALDRSTPTK